MEFDFGILEGKGISVTEGISYTGSSEKYVSALQRYFRGYESNKKALEDFLSSGDMDGYSIKAHSLKSNSRMIGASALGGVFEELELAAKEGKAEFVGSRTKEAMELYGRVIEAIRPFGEMEKVTAGDEISAEEARETAGKLLGALDDFDDELSAALAAKLEGYPFRITQRQKLKEAAGYISDFSYDEAAELIKEIIPAIE